MNMKYITRADQLEFLGEEEKNRVREVSEEYPFRCNSYYLSLIDWDDPEDPIRRIIIPHEDELGQWGFVDPSDEKNYTVAPGLEHKYDSTALLLVSDICEGICRYCFRKRVFTEDREEHNLDLGASVDYIKSHREITNVLLTGGDPLVLSTRKLGRIFEELRKIEHIGIIRIGSRMPVFNPYRILDDEGLVEMIGSYVEPAKKIYLMTHFIHPRELTEAAIEGVWRLQKAGVVVNNQMPLIKGVNDDPAVLAELLEKLAVCGIIPYYIFQCRPAMGNSAYTIAIERGYDIIEEAKDRVSGLAKRVRFVMSHRTGKVEVVGRDKRHTYFKYHRAAENGDSSKFIKCRRNPDASWLDDYVEVCNDNFKIA